jgi:hypothetical protein
MAERSKKSVPVAFDKPIVELRKLGESLQQTLALTTARVPNIKNPMLKLRTVRALDRAGYMFRVMSNTVQTVERVAHFLENGFGLSVSRMLEFSGEHEPFIHASTYSAMLLVNEGIYRVLHELNDVNKAIDQEAKNEKKS